MTQTTLKPRGVKRRLLGWMLLVIALTTGALWAASLLWGLKFSWPYYGLELQTGALGFTRSSYDRGSSYTLLWCRRVPEVIFYNMPPEPRLGGLVRYWNISSGFPYGMSPVAGMPRAATLGGKLEHWSVRLPPLCLASAAAGALLLWWGTWARRRPRKGYCRHCGYNLGGLAAGALCPECGK